MMLTAAMISRALCMLQKEQQGLNQAARRVHAQPGQFPPDAERVCALARDGLAIRAREGAALLMMLTAANDGAAMPAKA